MLIEEPTAQANLDLLARARLGRLACAQKSQPYVVPFYFAYHYDHLYSFSTIAFPLWGKRSSGCARTHWCAWRRMRW